MSQSNATIEGAPLVEAYAYFSYGLVYICTHDAGRTVLQPRERTMRLKADQSDLELSDGGTVFVCAYIGVDGLAGDLAEGATFTTHDGCTVTRRGEEALWTTPPKTA